MEVNDDLVANWNTYFNNWVFCSVIYKKIDKDLGKFANQST